MWPTSSLKESPKHSLRALRRGLEEKKETVVSEEETTMKSKGFWKKQQGEYRWERWVYVVSGSVFLGFGLLGMATLIYTATAPLAFADHKTKHNPGGGGGNNTDEVVTYSVVFTGPVDGGSGPNWVGSSRSIGDSNPHIEAGRLNLIDYNFWQIFDNAVAAAADNRDGDGDGFECFSSLVSNDPTLSIRDSGVTRLKRDQIEVSLWFDGRTVIDPDSGSQAPVIYILWMRGDLPDNWLPGDDVEAFDQLHSWEIEVANGQPELKPFSCTGEADFGEMEMLSVTGHSL